MKVSCFKTNVAVFGQPLEWTRPEKISKRSGSALFGTGRCPFSWELRPLGAALFSHFVLFNLGQRSNDFSQPQLTLSPRIENSGTSSLSKLSRVTNSKLMLRKNVNRPPGVIIT